jgi:sugar phosphate isomerase/epimerase
MKLGLINSAWFGSPFNTAEGIRRTKEIGFDTIDIFADPLEIDAVERRLIRQTCVAACLPVVSIACVSLGLADFNNSVRRFHIDRAKRHLDFGYDLFAHNLLLVLGEYVWQQEVITPSDQWKMAVDATREVGEHAASLGMEVAIELEPFELSLVNNVTKMVRFLDDVNHPAVRANVDISHVHLAHEPASSLAKLKGRIAHVHLSDCDGLKHGDLPPGRGVVNFVPYLEAVRDTGFDGTVSIELEYSPEPDRITEWVTEAYQKTDEMMQSLRIRG